MKTGSWFLLAGLAGLAALAARADAEELPLRIDEARSRVEIVVDATVDPFVGKLERYEALVAVDPAAGEVRSARLGFRFEDVKTGKADRDAQMHAWQDTARHPDGEFTLVSLVRGADGLIASGTLRLHGRARAIDFPVSVSHEGGLFAIDGDATLDTRDFGLPIIKKFLVLKVDPEVHVRFHLQGRVAPVAVE